MKKKYFSLFLTVLLSLSATIPARALSLRGYTPSAVYTQSIYNKNLEKITLTGDTRTDLVSVALSQVGYHEGNSEKDFNGASKAGSLNFAEYNIWYGKLDNSYGFSWCAAFVSWCLTQTGVSTTVVIREVGCQRWVNNLKERNQFQKRGTYIPRSGDLIFFSENSSGWSSHIGIVSYVDGARVYTVEGNSSNQVSRCSYSLTDAYILGYGTPAYPENQAVAIDRAKQAPCPGYYAKNTTAALKIYQNPGESVAQDSLSPVGLFLVNQLQTVNGTLYGKLGETGWIAMSDGNTYFVCNAYASCRFEDDEQNVLATLTLPFGSLPTAPVAPQKDGFAFAGWSAPLGAITGDTVYIAVYEKLPDPVTQPPSIPEMTQPSTAPASEAVTPGNDEQTADTEPAITESTEARTGAQTAQSELSGGCSSLSSFPGIALLSLLPLTAHHRGKRRGTRGDGGERE